MPIKKVMDGFPIYPGGSKKLSVFDFKGPSSYSTGGETLSAAQFGESGIDFIEPMNKGIASCTQGAVARNQLFPLSFSGTYFVTITVATTAEGAIASVTVMWFVAATGAEVAAAVDLSAEEFRALAVFI